MKISEILKTKWRPEPTKINGVQLKNLKSRGKEE